MREGQRGAGDPHREGPRLVHAPLLPLIHLGELSLGTHGGTRCRARRGRRGADLDLRVCPSEAFMEEVAFELDVRGGIGVWQGAQRGETLERE